jgi:RHS repeat-associated protein
LTGPRFGYRRELSIGDNAVYLRGRWYQPQVGRFAARDPLSTLVGQARPDSPYPYADNDPLDKVDPLGTFALFDFISRLLSYYLSSDGLNRWEHPDPGNSLGRHLKCFQGQGPLYTRGWNIPEECLDGLENCLGDLWKDGPEEKAAHALAINELARQYESWGSRVKDDQLGLGTYISKDIDWEVGALVFAVPQHGVRVGAR